ncbi:MAG: aminomethyl-transferring glycine dehydrogenase subunit GcvPA [Candidatus Zixiibacteriota bacterium]|nr:MAG: aminomethyl-transferring glycine dehydrogenase subunit GcvPA [candidate division Zixibacteria bacterium]
MPYVPNTDIDRRIMLERIGVKDIEELFSVIPDGLRLKNPLDIPSVPEMQLVSEGERLSRGNGENLVCFAGGGVYDHFIPAAVGTIISRPEFMTAYTPYQAEVSQGTLQVIYEFQTHLCRLTGMDVANASMYDGATAAAEAVIMATGVTRRKKVVVSETVNPLYRDVIATYLSGRDVELVAVPMKDGTSDIDRIEDVVDDSTACLLVAQPNFFGLLEGVESAAEVIHKAGGKLIMAVDPIAQAILKTPGEYGADIVVGEGQPLGMPISFGGPLLGFFAARKEMVRYMPGRIASRTKDVDGREGFVLTLQTREQHIRREKATSNICTNQALCATAASVYLTLMGKTGLEQAALLSAEKAQQAARKLCEIEGIEAYFDGPFVREFPLRTPMGAQKVIMALLQNGLLAGINAGRWYKGLDDCLIMAVTEKRTDHEIQMLADRLKELTKSGVLSSM